MLSRADADENEVCVGGYEFQAELAKRILEVIQALGVVGARAGEVVLVVQGRQRAGLGEGIDVERLADFFERGNQLWMADAITEADPGQAENLGKRPHQQQVRL